jgi:Mob1/phocein family
VRYKRPTKLPAPEYVDALMNWTQSILDDEAVFPNTIGTFFLFPLFPRAADERRRCVIPPDIQGHCAHHCAKTVSCVCTHIQQPL